MNIVKDIVFILIIDTYLQPTFNFLAEDLIYHDFYDEVDNRIKIENSMDMIFFGPPSSFLRIDAETILHILLSTKKNLIPISRALLAWDVVTGKHLYRLHRYLQSLIVFSSPP